MHLTYSVHASWLCPPCRPVWRSPNYEISYCCALLIRMPLLGNYGKVEQGNSHLFRMTSRAGERESKQCTICLSLSSPLRMYVCTYVSMYLAICLLHMRVAFPLFSSGPGTTHGGSVTSARAPLRCLSLEEDSSRDSDERKGLRQKYHGRV